MGGFGKGGGLTKANAAARREIERALTRPCKLHPGRPAVAVILSMTMLRHVPACAECARYALTQGGYSVIKAPGVPWDGES